VAGLIASRRGAGNVLGGAGRSLQYHAQLLNITRNFTLSRIAALRA
jgi:hypothetical protein